MPRHTRHLNSELIRQWADTGKLLGDCGRWPTGGTPGRNRTRGRGGGRGGGRGWNGRRCRGGQRCCRRRHRDCRRGGGGTCRHDFARWSRPRRRVRRACRSDHHRHRENERPGEHEENLRCRPMTKPVGPYTPIVRAGDFLICSGQVGQRDGKLVDGDVTAQTAAAIENIATLLAQHGAALTDVAKTMCFLVDMGEFGRVQRGVHHRFRRPSSRTHHHRRGRPADRGDRRDRGVGVQAGLTALGG